MARAAAPFVLEGNQWTKDEWEFATEHVRGCIDEGYADKCLDILSGANTKRARSRSLVAGRSQEWRERNVIEVVRLAVLAAHMDSDPFYFEDVVRYAQDFYCGQLSASRIVGAMLAERMVDGDFQADALRLADTPPK